LIHGHAVDRSVISGQELEQRVVEQFVDISGPQEVEVIEFTEIDPVEALQVAQSFGQPRDVLKENFNDLRKKMNPGDGYYFGRGQPIIFAPEQSDRCRDRCQIVRRGRGLSVLLHVAFGSPVHAQEPLSCR